MLLYDWVSVVFKSYTVEQIISLLGLDEINFESIYGFYGYADRLYYDGIGILYNPHSADMGILLEMSGQGCRVFETMGTGDYDGLFQLVADNKFDMNITRLDVAFDDHVGIFNMATLCKETKKENFISRFRAWKVTEGSGGASIEHGSMASDVFIRIYDKAAERKRVGEHWIRVELQLRKERALNFALLSDQLSFKYFGVLNNYLRYVRPTADSHRDRWPMARFWVKFVDHLQKIKLYEKPGMDYNLSDLKEYVFGQAGKSIYTAVKCLGEDKFLETVHNIGRSNLNSKQKQLIDQHTV